MDDNIQKLAALFERLPGIGPRQAKRFVYALLDEDAAAIQELAAALLSLKQNTHRCKECFRAFGDINEEVCSICRSQAHSPTILLVERDTDLENIEKLGVYKGAVFILGGVVSPLGEGVKSVRLRELFDKIKRSEKITELIIATSATSEGDTTAAYVTKVLEEFVKIGKLKITRLGRGLSTGTQIEFSDRATFEQAIKNRN